MGSCEMCGKVAPLQQALVEGVNLAVCSACLAYGKPKVRSDAPAGRQKPNIPEGPSYSVVPDFSFRLKRAREARKMTQKEFAAVLRERESVVANWEQGTVRPSLDVARRLEKQLGFLLVEEDHESTAISSSKKKCSDGLTLGDFMKTARKQ